MPIKEINPAFKFAILTIPSSLLLIVPAYSDPINLPKMMILIPFTITALILFISLHRYGPKSTLSLENRLLVFLYCLLGISMILTGYLGSQNYVRIFFGATGRNNGLIYYISVILVAIIILRISIGQLELKFLDRVLTWSSLLFMSYCSIQFFNLDPVSWSNPYNRVIGTLGNPNFSASALACFSTYWIFKYLKAIDRQPLNRFILLLPAIVMIFLSWSTQSLQGLIVSAMGLCLIVYMYCRERWSSQIVPTIFFLGGGSILFFLFAAFLGFGPLGSSLEQYTLKLRGWYALFGIQSMLNSPLLGVGVDNYISAFRTFRSGEFVSQYGSVLSSNNAHSTPVQIGSSFGLLVFSIYCVIQLLILFRALSVLSSRDPLNDSIKGIALVWVLIFSQSILSIEIIGLGVMNWVLGAIILSASKNKNSILISDEKASGKSNRIQNYPVWTSPIAAATLCVGAFTAIPISIEDKAFQNLSLYQVNDANSKKFAVENFDKLSNLTLYYPDKLDRIIRNMFDAGLRSEVELAVKELYRVEPDDAYAADILASYYMNSRQFLDEIEIRKRQRNLDPWNLQIELALAKAYNAVRDEESLRESIERLKTLNPSSIELQEAKSFLLNYETGS